LKEAEKVIELVAAMETDSGHVGLVTRARAFLNLKET
jgi:hypothetical protein